MDKNRDEYNRAGLIAFVGSVVFCTLFFIYVAYLSPEIDLKEVPTTQAGAVKVDLNKIEKPWEENPALVARGKVVYESNCASCHGKTGLGDGVALNPPPRNLVEGQWKHGGSSKDLYVTLVDGFGAGSAMVSFKHLPKVDRWAVVQYIRSITKNKVPDNASELDAYGKTAE